jgi:hypothetical protein
MPLITSEPLEFITEPLRSKYFFNDSGSEETMLLPAFASRYLGKVVVDKIEVKPLTPDPGQPGGLTIGATERQLLGKLIEFISAELA